MADDFETQLLRDREAALTAEYSQAQANYQMARHMNDIPAGNEAFDAMQEIEAKFAAGRRKYNEYRQRQSYRAPALTDQEFMALSPERMAQNPEAVDMIFQKSKFYKKDQWSDPEIQKRVLEGFEEVQRRRNYEAGPSPLSKAGRDYR